MVFGWKGNDIIIAVLLENTGHVSSYQDIIKILLYFLLFEALKVRLELFWGSDYFPQLSIELELKSLLNRHRCADHEGSISVLLFNLVHLFLRWGYWSDARIIELARVKLLQGLTQRHVQELSPNSWQALVRTSLVVMLHIDDLLERFRLPNI